MKQQIKKLADQHAPLFWILSLFILVIVCYKGFSLLFLDKTPYEWDVTFLRLSISLTSILTMKELYGNHFSFHFKPVRVFSCLLLSFSAYPFILFNLIGQDFTKPIVAESLIMALISNLTIGFFEETLLRGMILGHMLLYWKEDSHRYIKAVLYSSLLFGVLHIGNISTNGLTETSFQVFYATAIGILFASVYLRTQSLLPLVFIHGMIDFSSSMDRIFYTPEEYVSLSTSYTSDEMLTFAIFVTLLSLIVISCGLFLIRKKQHPLLDSFWA